jgi:hypothetical protein
VRAFSYWQLGAASREALDWRGCPRSKEWDVSIFSAVSDGFRPMRASEADFAPMSSRLRWIPRRAERARR